MYLFLPFEEKEKKDSYNSNFLSISLFFSTLEMSEKKEKLIDKLILKYA